jgi:hypothetical protein
VGTQTPPPTQKFSVGDSVQTNSNLNVRTSPSTGEKTIVGTQPIASAGKVVAGPTTAVGYTWWNVDYVNAPDGWSVENYLDKTSGVIVPPPSNTPTLTLSASPTSITAGQSSTLSWSSTNATSCTATGGWSGTLATSGTQTVTPTANTTYTLACTGTGGTATQSATVVVGSTTGGSVTLKFNSTQPKDVYAGYSMIGSIRVSNGTTNNDYVDVAVQNIPTGMTFTWLSGVNYSAKGLNLQVYHGDGEAAYRIAASSNVAPGDYSLNLIATERTTGISSTLNVPFTVTASPSPITKLPVGASPALPAMTKYNSDMLKYAQTYCNSTLSAGVESGVWYYDGERVYYNISDYTGDPTWGNTCAQNVESMYKNYVISNNGGVPGWRNFSKGLRMDYERTGDATSKTAALLLARSYPLYWNVDQTSSREIAYAIDSMINAEKLGSARNPELANMVDLALGHIDQWAVAKNASYLPPFMVALTAEALIGYYDLTGDPRVPVSLKAAADHIWNVAWDNTSQSFYYYDRLVTGQGGRTPAPDLNNLISPLYGWLYSITGDTKYLTQGDQIFTGGVNGAWLGQGKPFSQNYRWSMNYLKWTGRIPNINLPAFTMNSGQTVVLGASTTGIGIGDSVVTTSNLNVRDAANGSLLGKQPVGMFGTVKAGPVSVGGYTWWNIDYVNAPDGWSVENYLLKK